MRNSYSDYLGVYSEFCVFQEESKNIPTIGRNSEVVTDCASASDLNIILFCFVLDYLLFYILYSQRINNSLEL